MHGPKCGYALLHTRGKCFAKSEENITCSNFLCFGIFFVKKSIITKATISWSYLLWFNFAQQSTERQHKFTNVLVIWLNGQFLTKRAHSKKLTNEVKNFKQAKVLCKYLQRLHCKTFYAAVFFFLVCTHASGFIIIFLRFRNLRMLNAF